MVAIHVFSIAYWAFTTLPNINKSEEEIRREKIQKKNATK